MRHFTAVPRAEHKMVQEIMVFLHSHGVGTAGAVRVYKTYGGRWRAGYVGNAHLFMRPAFSASCLVGS